MLLPTTAAIDALERRQHLATLIVETYHDRDFSNQYSDGDTPIAGRTVELNMTPYSNTVLTAVSDAQGRAVFEDLAPGSSVTIRQIAPQGWWVDGPMMFSVGQTQTLVRSVSNDKALVAGRAYDDTDRNGYFTAGDLPVSGRTFFVDFDDDNEIDQGEPVASTDGNGAYGIELAPAGRYVLRAIIPEGHRALDGGLDPVRIEADLIIGYKRNYRVGSTDLPEPGRISIRPFYDANANGVRDDGERTLYRDIGARLTNLQGQPQPSFPLQPGTYVVGGDLVTGFAVTTPFPRQIALSADEHVVAEIGLHSSKTTPPAVVASSIDTETASFRIQVQFDDYVWEDLLNDAVLRRVFPSPSTTFINPSFITREYDLQTNTLSMTFNGRNLIDGQYQLELPAGSCKNLAGIGLATMHTLPFHLLKGDANRDRSVNFSDLLILAQNYGQTGRTFSQGNINYSADGKVDFDDLLLLAQRYGTSLVVNPAERRSAKHRLALRDPLDL